ncbi:hypothetical protein VNO78_26939 [Psophocarpus tetragonolobus]|uniref:Uncharacterized protein n=1 Tax=Psophocarpus tetragonolobus TaxID=3891 RepID=A0AAN9RZY5_PSOTE
MRNERQLGEELAVVDEVDDEANLGFGGQNLEDFEDVGVVVVEAANGVDLIDNAELHCNVNVLCLSILSAHGTPS